MAVYELSTEAQKDLAGLYRYGLKQFGFQTATDYSYSFLNVFELIAAFPEAYAEVPDIAAGLRRAVHRSHAIYFEGDADNQIKIIRILGRQDPYRAFEP